MEEYDFEKLAREIVVSRLNGSDNAPAAAAEIAKEVMVTSVKSTKTRQDPHLTISAVCRGVMSGLLLIEKDMPQAAAVILKELPQIAPEIEPADVMTWAMEGIASVAMLAGPDKCNAIQARIEQNFMGAGAVFSEICAKVPDKR